VQKRVVWRIKRKNPLRGLTCGCVEEKKAHINKNFCVYFTHLLRSPPWRDLHKILHYRSPRHAKIYLSWFRGFDSVGVEFLASPQEREVAINTGLELPFSLWYVSLDSIFNLWSSEVEISKLALHKLRESSTPISVFLQCLLLTFHTGPRPQWGSSQRYFRLP